MRSTMANPHRGEIEADLNGERVTLCLTLGALAELEHAFGVSDLAALADRFQSGRLSSSDVISIVHAGMRGGGRDIGIAEVASLTTPGGAAGFVAIVADLLQATFGGPATATASHDMVHAMGKEAAAAEAADPAPFPGPMR